MVGDKDRDRQSLAGIGGGTGGQGFKTILQIGIKEHNVQSRGRIFAANAIGQMRGEIAHYVL